MPNDSEEEKSFMLGTYREEIWKLKSQLRMRVVSVATVVVASIYRRGGILSVNKIRLFRACAVDSIVSRLSLGIFES